MNRLRALHDAGVSIWLDDLSRELLESGELARLIAEWSITGTTSNPTIFAKAIAASDRYDEQLRAAIAAGGRTPRELFWSWRSRTCAARPTSCGGRTMGAPAATGSCRSSARPTWPTTRTRR